MSQRSERSMGTVGCSARNAAIRDEVDGQVAIVHENRIRRRRCRITEGAEEIQMRKVGQHLFGFGKAGR